MSQPSHGVPPRLRVRRFHVIDAEEIVALFRATVHNINSRDYSQDQLQVWAPAQIDVETWRASLVKNYSVVAEIAGRIVGFADLADHGYINRIFVHQDFQRGGIATRLLNTIERAARRNGLTRLIADVSITARPFFAKHGYMMLAEQHPIRNGVTLTNYRMERLISS
jgi:putative acetyltransferase